MQKALNNYIQQEKLFSLNNTILLAVSGGVDSVVLCDLLSKATIKFAIAHCNFTLRDKESDRDANFVEQLAEKYKVPFHFISFPTLKISKQNKESVQVAARNLRYEWFEKIREEFKYDFIATAHHQNDTVETFFINLLRGSGIKGLIGIPNKYNKIVRPLLFASKEEILVYAKKNKLNYREDSSNGTDKYLRNKIRLKLIPLLKEINPQFEGSIVADLKKLNDTEKIYTSVIEAKRKKIVKEKNGTFFISINDLKKLYPVTAYLYEFIKIYGFNGAQTNEIVEQFEGESGKLFFSSNYRLLKDRKHLIISPLNKETENNNFIILEKTKNISWDLKRLNFSIKKNNKSITSSEKIACLDVDKLTFPLTIRKWQQGDYFYPLGMNGKKKLSDFFIDKKISVLEKEKVWLLVSNNQVVWVIGHRIDNRFKITDKTSKIYFVELV